MMVMDTMIANGRQSASRMRVVDFLVQMRRRWKAAARVRIMVYALLASIFCGVTGFLEPVDDAIRNHRYLARDVPADGSIVVVGIDDKSLGAIKERWPWSRAQFAILTEQLKKAGANKVVFDKALADHDTPANDRKFIAVAKAYPGDVVLGAGFGQSVNGRVENMVRPAATIRPYVQVASFKARFNPFGQIDEVYSEVVGDGKVYPGLAAVLAGRPGNLDKIVRPDFAIRAESFPYLSASDVILGERPIGWIKGKDVLVGDVARSLQDIRFLPSQGARPGVFVFAIAAQTIKTGVPVDVGWFGPFALAVVAGSALLLVRSAVGQIAINLLIFGLFVFGPIALDARHVSVEVGPAILLMVVTLILNARLRLGWRKSRMNEGSGLDNVVALRELDSRHGTALIAAKIANYAAIVASFPREVETSIVAEIVGRLRLRDEGLRVYQADDGVFYWVSPIADSAKLGDHLDGLKAMFSSAIKVGDRRVDVAISFGADLDWSRPVASRVGSALMSAEEAVRTGERWKLYDPARTIDAAWHLSLISEMDHAMDREQFWLAYQPKVNARTGKIVGAEVLLRWTHPERGEISPAEFIPAAERSQRIGRLTDYVIDRTFFAARTLLDDGGCKLSINVSIPVLGDPNFAGALLRRCQQSEVPPGDIMIEITESVLMSIDDRQVETTLAELRNCGFGLSIDDFGTGFSSLEYVRRIPAHEMKIDQSFVRRVTSSSADRVVVESVLRMAHELGRNVVAEGVENQETLDLLRELGCDEVQGFHTGRPVPFASFRDALLLERRSAA